MQAIEITKFLDERISDLAKNRLPDAPIYPSGDSRYASFMTSHDEINMSAKSPERYSSYHDRSNGSHGHPAKQDKVESIAKTTYGHFLDCS